MRQEAGTPISYRAKGRSSIDTGCRAVYVYRLGTRPVSWTQAWRGNYYSLIRLLV